MRQSCIKDFCNHLQNLYLNGAKFLADYFTEKLGQKIFSLFKK